jgi:isochorismate synthase
VLARGIRVRARRLDPTRALRRLRAGYPGCTLFAVCRGDRCFLGATPERLVRVRGGALHTAAVAGSAPRGLTAEDDARLGAGLLAGRKDRLEHDLVVEAIRDALSGMLETAPDTPEPVLLKVRNVQHLYTPYEGVLRRPHSVLELVDRLHPTPAVGGVPRDAALGWIRRHEGWDRGWYAGPVLWMDRAGEGESAVAIRSALLGETEGRLFAGCGIMADSDPDEEYAESMLKCRAMLSALNGASGHEHA